MRYSTLRSIHLLCGVFALPFLLLYGASAVQMAHPKWIRMKPAITESQVAIGAGISDARAVMRAAGVRGEIAEVKETPAGFAIQARRPGTEYRMVYDRFSGTAQVQSRVAGFWGMMNRLHHAAGLWHEYGPLQWWGVLCALTSIAAIGLGVTGLWMWWMRKQERRWGLLLLAVNVVFAVAVLGMMRAAGP